MLQSAYSKFGSVASWIGDLLVATREKGRSEDHCGTACCAGRTSIRQSCRLTNSSSSSSSSSRPVWRWISVASQTPSHSTSRTSAPSITDAVLRPGVAATPGRHDDVTDEFVSRSPSRLHTALTQWCKVSDSAARRQPSRPSCTVKRNYTKNEWNKGPRLSTLNNHTSQDTAVTEVVTHDTAVTELVTHDSCQTETVTCHNKSDAKKATLDVRSTGTAQSADGSNRRELTNINHGNNPTYLDPYITCIQNPNWACNQRSEIKTSTLCRFNNDPIRPQNTHFGPQNTRFGPQNTHFGPQNTHFGPLNTRCGPQSARCGPGQLDDYFHSIVLRLIEAGDDVNEGDSSGYSPLMLACNSGVLTAIQLLLNAGCDVNARNLEGATALMLAAANDDVISVRTLMQVGASADVRDCHSHTALMDACRRGGHQVALTLVQQGASINIKDFRGRSALHLAILYGHLKIASNLAHAQSCHVNMKDEDGFTPLYLAAWDPLSRTSHDPELELLIQTLCDRGADPSSCDNTLISPIIRAWPRKSIVKLLVKNGASLNILFRIGRNSYPLPLVAALENDFATVEFLKKAGYNSKTFLRSRVLFDRKHADVISEVEDIFSLPLSLAQLCRIEIRHLIGNVHLRQKLHKLPIPQRIVSSLFFET